MALSILLVLIGLEIKHFLADYVLQPRWIIVGKASLARLGGYAHVGVHMLGSLVVLALAGLPRLAVLYLLLAEAVAHYIIDYVKMRWSRKHPSDVAKASFWAAHGLDQFMHQLTYALMLYAVLRLWGVS